MTSVLKDKIAHLIESPGITNIKLVGVGIGMTRFVNEIRSTTNCISEIIEFLVLIDNDSSMVALELSVRKIMRGFR